MLRTSWCKHQPFSSQKKDIFSGLSETDCFWLLLQGSPMTLGTSCCAFSTCSALSAAAFSPNSSLSDPKPLIQLPHCPFEGKPGCLMSHMGDKTTGCSSLHLVTLVLMGNCWSAGFGRRSSVIWIPLPHRLFFPCAHWKHHLFYSLKASLFLLCRGRGPVCGTVQEHGADSSGPCQGKGWLLTVSLAHCIDELTSWLMSCTLETECTPTWKHSHVESVLLWSQLLSPSCTVPLWEFIVGLFKGTQRKPCRTKTNGLLAGCMWQIWCL